MKTASVNNSPNFGHSFRVSICLKDINGLGNTFINPAKDEKLYKTLNSKIVNWLNEDYYTYLRKTYGKERKVSRIKPTNDNHRQMLKELKNIDSDYARFGFVRSIYRKNALAYIATGADAVITENLKGIKFIGQAKADSVQTLGHAQSQFVKDLVKAVKNNVLRYVESTDVLLRSKDNKEIMLKAVFKQTGKNKYNLDSFEFHENKTKPTLEPVTQRYIRQKNSADVSKEIQHTVQSHVNKLFGQKSRYTPNYV